MATALGSDCSTQPSLISSTGWSCNTTPTTDRHSPTNKCQSAVPWTHPRFSISPQVRPSTAIGWGDREEFVKALVGRSCGTSVVPKEGCMDSSHREGKSRTIERGISQEDLSEESQSDLTQAGPQKVKLLDVIQSRRKGKDKFRHLMSHLLQGSSTINSTGEHEMTPLHYAVLNGDEMCVKALVAFGANINAKNIFKQTPLDIASENQQEHLVPLLVSIGCLNGRNIPTVTSHQPPARQRAFSNPHEVLGLCRIGGSSKLSCRRRSEHSCEYLSERCSVKHGSDSDLSKEMERHIERKFEASESLKLDEAFAMGLQKQEIVKFKSRCPPEPPSRTTSPFPSMDIKRGGRGEGGGNRILCLDGGGIRGLIQIDILCEIERLTGKKITELFDWIIGTSTGGIVALALVYGQMSLSRLRDLYYRLKVDVFSKGRVGFCYDSTRLEELLKEELGTELCMGDIKHPKVLVCAVDKSNLPLKLNFFNNCFDDQFSHELIWKVARYTSAAPMYFSEYENYVDGGVLANNPCIHGLSKIQSFYQDLNIHLPITCMVSIGSGVYPSQELGSVDLFHRLKFAGMLRRAQSLITMLSSAIGESEALAERCKISCEMQNIPFFRFSPPLDEKLDAAVTDNIKLLQMVISTRIYTHAQKSHLEKLLPLLQRNSTRL